MIDQATKIPEVQPIVRYRLLQQFGNDQVKIRDLWMQTEFTTSVNKLVINEEIMAQFRGNDACTLGYIFGIQENNPIDCK